MTSTKKGGAVVSDDYELVRLLLLGDSGVGKSNLLLRFSDDAFSSSFITTIGIDFKIKTITLDGRKIKLQIWDTAGQERFRTVTKAYYRGAHGILFVFDVTNAESFDHISNWLRDVEVNVTNSDQLSRVLIGNKSDMDVRDHVVTDEQVIQLLSKYNDTTEKIKYFKTSAKLNINVTDAFHTLILDVIGMQSAKLDEEKQKNRSKIVIQTSSHPQTLREKCCD